MLEPALAGAGAGAGAGAALRAALLRPAVVAGTTGATAAFLAGDLRVALAGAGAGAAGTGMAAPFDGWPFLTAGAVDWRPRAPCPLPEPCGRWPCGPGPCGRPGRPGAWPWPLTGRRRRGRSAG